MKIRISFHIGFSTIVKHEYENIYVPVPKEGDTIIISERDIRTYFNGSDAINDSFYNPIFQFIVKSMDYLYSEDYICVYINLLEFNRIKFKSDSVGIIAK